MWKSPISKNWCAGILIVIFAVLIGCTRANLSSNKTENPSLYETERLSIIKKLSTTNFEFPEDKLLYMESEIKKVEKQFLPDIGTTRKAIATRFKNGIETSNPMNANAIKNSDSMSYELIPGTFLYIDYQNDKVISSRIIYQTLGTGSHATYKVKQRALKTQTHEEELKERLGDVEFDYIGSQILLRTYQNKNDVHRRFQE